MSTQDVIGADLFAPLRGSENARRGWGRHVCHAEGCEIEVPPKLLMCAKHWRQVPRTIQRAIWRHYRPGQEVDKAPTSEYVAVMKQAIAAVAGRSQNEPSSGTANH